MKFDFRNHIDECITIFLNSIKQNFQYEQKKKFFEYIVNTFELFILNYKKFNKNIIGGSAVNCILPDTLDDIIKNYDDNNSKNFDKYA
ncbi:hypothetical protein COBT_004047, partial [Conglomerata obtusa]